MLKQNIPRCLFSCSDVAGFKHQKDIEYKLSDNLVQPFQQTIGTHHHILLQTRNINIARRKNHTIKITFFQQEQNITGDTCVKS